MNKETHFALESLELINRLDLVARVLGPYKKSTDVDGVEVNLTQSALEKLNAIKGTNYDLSLINTYWGFVNLLQESHPEIVDPRQYAFDLWHTTEVLLNAKPVEGMWALNYIEQKDPDWQMLRITSRPLIAKENTIEWYRLNKPWLDSTQIRIQDESFETGLDFKVQTIINNQIELHFEDSVEHAEAIIAATALLETKPRVVIVPQYWNISTLEKHSDLDPRILVPSTRVVDNAKIASVYANLLEIL